MSNFSYLTEKNQFKSFASACMEAENSLLVSPATCAITTRRALELAVKWVYQADNAVRVPYRKNLFKFNS